MELRIHQSIDEIAPEAWDAIVKSDSIFNTHAYLSVIEEAGINDCRYCYPVVYEHGRIEGHACLYAITTELDVFVQGVVKRWIDSVRRRLPRFLLMRTVECGVPVAPGSSISIRHDVCQKKVLHHLVGAVDEAARRWGIRITLLRDFHERDMRHAGAVFCSHGYRIVENLPFSAMDVPWTSMNEYVGALRSSYRRKMRKRQERFRERGGTLTRVYDFSNLVTELMPLYCNVFKNAKEYKRERLTRRFFEQISDLLGDQSFIILARVGNTAVGFCLLVQDSRTLHWLYCGLDYVLSQESAAYFAMLYEIVRCGIECGANRIDFGMTTLDAKLDIGAKRLPSFMYMKHTNPCFSSVLCLAFKALTPQQIVTSKRVFRK